MKKKKNPILHTQTQLNFRLINNNRVKQIQHGDSEIFHEVIKLGTKGQTGCVCLPQINQKTFISFTYIFKID